MDWYEGEVRALERHTPPPGTIVFYGSSSFRLWDTLARDVAPWPVSNRAFGGSTLAACAYFFERLVVPCAPRSLVCYAGDNDLGDGQPPHAVITSFRALLDQVDRRIGPIPVAFLAIKPSPARWNLRPQILAVNEGVRQVLAARPLGYFVDAYGPMLRRNGLPRQDLFADDGLHLSPAGYHLWTQIVLAYRYPLFEP